MTFQVSGGRVYLKHFLVQYLLINFYFLNNDKDYHKDFFTTGTIDDGLSFDGIKSYFWSNFSGSMLYTILGGLSTCGWQLGRISVINYFESSLIWKSTSNCVESRWKKFVILNFGIKSFSTICCYNLCLNKSDTLHISNALLDNNPIFGKVIPCSDSPWNSLQVCI